MSYGFRRRRRSTYRPPPRQDTNTYAPPPPPAGARPQRTIKAEDGDTQLIEFADLPDFGRYAAARLNLTPDYSTGEDRNASGFSGQSNARALAHALQGDESQVAPAMAILDSLDAAFETPRYQYTPAPAGAYFVMPEVLAGLPACMRRKQRRPGQGPIRMYVDLTSSGGIPHQKLTRRGHAALALASRLSNSRPVELFGIIGLNVGSDAGMLTIPISSSPLNLSLASAALCSIGIIRGLGYAILNLDTHTNGGWCWELDPTNEKRRDVYVEKMRRTLDLSPEDILVPPPYLGDEIARDPVAWIQTHLNDLQKEED